MWIQDINVAAAISTATGTDAILEDYQEDGRTGFYFPDSNECTRAAALFYSGELSLPARQLLRIRADLFSQIKRRGRR